MRYPEEGSQALWKQHDETVVRLGTSVGRVVGELVPSLVKVEAQEFALYGVSRRLGLIQSCLRNIFKLYPPQRQELLARDDLQSLNINLHALS